MTTGIIARGVTASLACALSMLVPASDRAARAQTEAGATPGPSARLEVQRLPDAAACLDAFRHVDGWVRAWKTPESPASVDPDHTTGVCVTLRLSGAAGRTLARAVAWEDDAQRGALLWHATRAALIEAEPRLKLPNDATRDAARLELARRVQVDVQFAGTPVPLAGETLEAVASAINPGREGVLARLRASAPGEHDRTAAVFPASMLSMGLTPGRAAAVAFGQLKLPPVNLSELRKSTGVEVYRFNARHAAQVRAGEPPELLYRGGTLAPMQSVSTQGLRDFACAMADHLVSHRWRGPGAYGLRGNYNPLTDTYTPAVAGPREQAVAALALLRFAQTPGIAGEHAARAHETALAVLDQLTEQVTGEENPLTPLAAAAWLIASHEAGRCGVQPSNPEADAAAARANQFRTAALDALRGVVRLEEAEAGDRVTWLTPEGSPPLQPGEKALIAFALARTAGAEIAPRRLAAACVRDLFRTTEPGSLVGLMPWLAWAELELVTEPGAPVPSGEALRQLRALCWSRQVTPAQAGENPDLAGGIVFTKGADTQSGGASEHALAPDPSNWPTWHTLRPLAMLGTILGDARLTTDEELHAEVLKLLASLRFARQLGVDEPYAHMFRDPSRALGGVRPAVWEPTVTLDATSLALLSVCEALRSAEARSN